MDTKKKHKIMVWLGIISGAFLAGLSFATRIFFGSKTNGRDDGGGAYERAVGNSREAGAQNRALRAELTDAEERNAEIQSTLGGAEDRIREDAVIIAEAKKDHRRTRKIITELQKREYMADDTDCDG